jgi:hypothetical protein
MRMYSQEELQILERGEREYVAKGLISDKHNEEMIANYFSDLNPKIQITAASIKQAIDLMTEKNLLHWKSQDQVKFEQVSSGLSQRDLQILDSGLTNYNLVTAGDEGYANKVAMIEYLRGRQVSHDEIYRGAQYLMGKGVNLYFKPMPSQSTPHRGVNATRPPSSNDMVWISKEDANSAYLGRPNHALDERFNGSKERRERQEQERRLNMPHETFEDHNAAERLWESQIKQLVGETHSETARIQAVARQTPGSARQRFSAAKQEQAKIQREKQLSK